MKHNILYFSDLDKATCLTANRSSSTNKGKILTMKRVLKIAVETELTERQRFCVEEYYFNKRKMKDIARELGVNPSTVTRHIQTAKEKLGRLNKYF